MLGVLLVVLANYWRSMLAGGTVRLRTHGSPALEVGSEMRLEFHNFYITNGCQKMEYILNSIWIINS